MGWARLAWLPLAACLAGPALADSTHATSTAHAPDSTDTVDESQAPSATPPLWTESMLWTKDIVFRAGFGYKDNVLLAPSNAQGSPFLTTGLDLTLVRLPLDGWEVSLSLTGDDTRYFRNPDGLKGEDLFLVSAQVQKYFAGVWRSGIELRYSYVDEVLQALNLSGNFQTLLARGNLFSVRPFIRRDLGTNWWIQLETPLSREWWQFPLDDQWKLGGQAVLGHSYGQRSQVALSLGIFHIAHDDWLAQDTTGTEIPGRRLELWRPVAELKWEHLWDRAHRWSTTTRLGFNYESDNGGGYVDYYRYLMGEELRFHNMNWEVKAGATINYFAFPVQPSENSPNSKLRLTTLDLSFRLERRLYGSLRLFGAFAHEQTLSNEAMNEYRANVVTGGVSYEF